MALFHDPKTGKTVEAESREEALAIIAKTDKPELKPKLKVKDNDSK